MIFFDVFGNRIEKFAEQPKQETKEEPIIRPKQESKELTNEDILKNLGVKYSDGYIIKPVVNDLNDEEFLGLAGNISTTGIIKARDFVRVDDTPINEISVIPRNMKISDGELEIAGKFTANGDFVIKNNNKEVHKVDKNGNMSVTGNIKVNKNMIGNDPNGFVELRGGTPYIDFSHHESQGDFDNRIILQNRELSVTGNMNIRGKLNTPLVQFGNHNIPHPDNTDGAIYRADGQVQIATDDMVRIRDIRSKQTGIQLDARVGAGDVKNPNGQMKITRQGIMFGGPNSAGKEINSAQISAGLHQANSLNVVGMSSNNNANTRRVDVFSEGGMNVRSNSGIQVSGHGRTTNIGSQNAGWSHMTTTAPQFYMNKSLQVQGGVSSYHNAPLLMPHGADIRTNQGLKVVGHGRTTTVGSLNNQWSHIQTDAPQFFVNKNIQVNGGVSSYHNKPLLMPHGADVRTNNGLRVSGHGRTTTYGSVNNGWSHIQTDAPQFYINKSLQVHGGISSYHNQPITTPHGVNSKRDIKFTGNNNWIFHTPNDGRHTMYIAPSKARGNENWNWGNSLQLEPNGDVVIKGNLIFQHPNGQRWILGLRDSNHFAINKNNERGMLIRRDGLIFLPKENDKVRGVHETVPDKEWLLNWQHNGSRGRR
jgi:hypothetical protein